MQTLTIGVGALVALAGLVFAAQGLGLIGGSSLMDNDTRWTVIGAVLVVVGIVVGRTGWRRRNAS